MARAREASIDDVVREALDPVVRQAALAIARAVADVTAEKLEAELRPGAGKGRSGRGARGSARRVRARTEITKWAADRRARRVPTFVIESTGLHTKKQIVAKFGEGVIFEKGKPLPKPR